MHALVGANNAGKSSILKALDFLFNPSISKIDEETFWNKDKALEVWVEALFDSLNAEETQALQGYLRPDNTFHIARSAKFGVSSEDSTEDSWKGDALQ
jgi:AAA15 family ATPase/GTPase